MTIVRLTVFWGCGIWLASNLSLPRSYWLIGAGASGVLFLLLRHHNLARSVVAALALLCFGGARVNPTPADLSVRDSMVVSNHQEVMVVGTIVQEPARAARSLSVVVEAAEVQGATAKAARLANEGLILVQTERYAKLAYGTEVRLTGQLQMPPQADTFDYPAHLRRQGIYLYMPFPEIDTLAEHQGNSLQHRLLAFKAQAKSAITKQLPQPEAALLSGILLGDDSGLPQPLQEDFRSTGMSHIIAISGFNMMLLVGVLLSSGRRFLSPRHAAIVALVGTALYAMFVGGGASVVRAAIMAIVLVGTRSFLGRPVYPFASLAVAAFLLTLADPNALWDVGFQLSFAATLGLMLYGRPLQQWSQRWLARRASAETARRLAGLLSDTVLVTVAAQVLALPLIVYYFGQLSPISLPANILILPAQPGILIWGSLATLTGMVFPALGQVLSAVAWLFLHYTTTLVHLLAQLPLATVRVTLGAPALIACYGVLLAATWWRRQPAEQRSQLAERLRPQLGVRAALSLTVLLFLLVLAWFRSQPDGLLHVAFLDVGQGDAILLQTPSGRQVLLDGGAYPHLLGERLGAQMAFWDRSLDVVIASHADDDHVAGLLSAFDSYRIPLLLTNGATDEAGGAYGALLEAAGGEATSIHAARAGEVLTIDDGVRLEVLQPADGSPATENERSIVLRLVYDDFSLLLMGDAGAASERALVEGGRSLRALVLKAGHHGAASSSNGFFLDAVQPEVVIISAGADNLFGHPDAQVLQRVADAGATVLRTDRLGTIEVISDGRSMWWEAQR